MTAHNNTYEDAGKIRVCSGDIDYQGIVKHINDGVLIIREGVIMFANDAFCRYLGISQADVAGLQLDAAAKIPPEHLEQTRTIMRAVADGRALR